MFVGVSRVALHLPGNTSLKGKRGVVRKVVERTRAKFNASVAEVADNDLKRRAVIGVAVVGNTAAHVDSMLGRIGGFIESLAVAPIASRETEVIPLGGDIGTDEIQPPSPGDWPDLTNGGDEFGEDDL
jgi:uncharacterized protein YlxP (DUF503 family)